MTYVNPYTGTCNCSGCLYDVQDAGNCAPYIKPAYVAYGPAITVSCYGCHWSSMAVGGSPHYGETNRATEQAKADWETNHVFTSFDPKTKEHVEHHADGSEKRC